MQSFETKSLTTQAFLVYLLSLGSSIILSPLFGKIYIKIFKPRMWGGLFPAPTDEKAFFGGTILAYFLFLAFFVSCLLPKKKKVVWFLGVSLPFLIFLANGLKYILWACFFSALGWLLGKLVLYIKSNKKNI